VDLAREAHAPARDRFLWPYRESSEHRDDPLCAAAIEVQIEEERLAGMRTFAQHPHEGGNLRVGVTVEVARDSCGR
jgi:hypothetical protein